MYFPSAPNDFKGQIFPLAEELTISEHLIRMIKNIKSRCARQIKIITSIVTKTIDTKMMVTNGVGLEVFKKENNLIIFIMDNILANIFAKKFNVRANVGRGGPYLRAIFITKEIKAKLDYYTEIFKILELLEEYIKQNVDHFNGQAGSTHDVLLYFGLLQIVDSTGNGIEAKWLAENRGTPGPCHILDPDELFSSSMKTIPDPSREVSGSRRVTEYTYNILNQTSTFKKNTTKNMLSSYYQNWKASDADNIIFPNTQSGGGKKKNVDVDRSTQCRIDILNNKGATRSVVEEDIEYFKSSFTEHFNPHIDIFNKFPNFDKFPIPYESVFLN